MPKKAIISKAIHCTFFFFFWNRVFGGIFSLTSAFRTLYDAYFYSAPRTFLSEDDSCRFSGISVKFRSSPPPPPLLAGDFRVGSTVLQLHGGRYTTVTPRTRCCAVFLYCEMRVFGRGWVTLTEPGKCGGNCSGSVVTRSAHSSSTS